ncbi:hypothetical protein Tco_1485211 [Tanacetum coccineum]
MRVFLLKLIFTFPGELGRSSRVPLDLDDRNTTFLQTFILTVHNLNRFFDKATLVVDFGFCLMEGQVFRRISISSGLTHDNYYGLDSTVPGVRVGFSSHVGITLLTVMGGLNLDLDLNNILGCLMNNLWTSELDISNFSPTDG